MFIKNTVPTVFVLCLFQGYLATGKPVDIYLCYFNFKENCWSVSRWETSLATVFENNGWGFSNVLYRNRPRQKPFQKVFERWINVLTSVNHKCHHKVFPKEIYIYIIYKQLGKKSWKEITWDNIMHELYIKRGSKLWSVIRTTLLCLN